MRIWRRQIAFVSYASRVALSTVLSLLLTSVADLGIAAVRAAGLPEPSAASLAPISPVPIILTATTLPSQGQAGSSVIYITGSGYPADAIPAPNVTISFATSCGGAPVASLAPSALQLLYGTTRRAQVLIPAALAANTYFLSVSGASSSGISFASSNCSQVQVASGVGPATKLVFTTQPTK